MSLFFSEFASDLTSDDQELVKITLVKLSRVTPNIIEDTESYYLINHLLRDISLSSDQLIDLAILVRDRLDNLFSLRKSLSAEEFKECCKILESEGSSTDQIYKAIIHSSDYPKIEDLSPYKPFLMNDNSVIRCASLEIYHYHSKLQNISDIVGMLNDPNLTVKKFTIRVLNRFGERAVLNCLNKMIDSDEERSKISAIHCIKNLKTNVEIIQMLKKCSLPGSEKVRSEAILALINHNCEETIELLKQLQNDLSIQICELAHYALSKLEHSSINGVQLREISSTATQ